MSVSIAEVTSILTVGVGLIGVVAAWQVARRAHQVSEATRQVSVFATLLEWRRELRNWAAEVIDEIGLIQSQVADAGDLAIPIARLSALLERGRHFFPNQDRDKYGLEKIEAYRGWRHAVLDPIAAAIRVASLHSGPGKYSSRAEAIEDMRRHFVSRTQGVLGVDDHIMQIAGLIRQSARSADPTLGGLLPAPDRIPNGAEAML